ncbi:MAG: methylmalonyl-CoA mutase family protein, partial [bacterium]
YLREAIARSAYQWQLDVESGKRVIVGVNRYRLDSEQLPPILKISPNVENEQIERIEKLKKRRDNHKVKIKLNNLKLAAASPQAPLMEPIIEAAEAYATIGEMSQALTEIWGEWKTPF